MDRPQSGSRHRLRRAAVAVLALATAGLLGFGVPGTGSAGHGNVSDHGIAGDDGIAGEAATPGPVTTDDPALDDSEAVRRGRELYGQSCASCHGQQGEGTHRGPSLEGVGAASADFYLSTGRMPIDHPDEDPRRREPALNEDEIHALVSYVASLGDGPPIPTVEEGDASQGRHLYLGSCASCHSPSTTGGAMPHGEVSPSLVPSAPTQIAEAIRLGPGTMPPFSEHALSDEEMNDLIAYVIALREPRDHGGNPLGTYGPAVEGLVGWVVGLGLLLVVARMLGKRAP
ncbi:cytochrome bc1 complex diheme cytochrome c subunit [Phytoactinopolyspora halotolerans]|uniref:C-type cytochrome n=1 Tax=Phytoactinopolyspora halotolerans TaxID=1981512 RepID=A0A6L9SA93_9ACTN|nr:c-type cytochrome [Phytoactinopolyspora halotolerans]NEE02027.1 c-type cytochrome [Phytoactinopolyspora halotolerans]